MAERAISPEEQHICADAIAHTLGRTLLIVRYAELESMWLGETPNQVAGVFRRARS